MQQATGRGSGAARSGLIVCPGVMVTEVAALLFTFLPVIAVGVFRIHWEKFVIGNPTRRRAKVAAGTPIQTAARKGWGLAVTGLGRNRDNSATNPNPAGSIAGVMICFRIDPQL